MKPGRYACFLVLGMTTALSAADALQPLKYNNPGLIVDLGVGLWAWPLPMDYDNDGDLDLVVSCPDVPSNGIYFFENPGGDTKFPIFKPGKRLSASLGNIQACYVGNDVRLLTPGHERVDFRSPGFGSTKSIYPTINLHGPKARLRANQWKYADLDGDDRLDLVVGVEDWADYGWDNAYDSTGRWTNGPLHGQIYWLRNTATTAAPTYAEPLKVEAGGKVIDTFGMPSPNFADFDLDGDLDLICGEFLDGFTYFENTGTKTSPHFVAGRRLIDRAGREIRMHLQMIVPVAIDWDRDGDTDLIVGDEDGRVALIENTAISIDGLPQFLPPVYFRQEADDLKFGALVTPYGVDWDGDGDDDLVCGNSSGEIAVFENLDGKNPPKWAAPRLIEAADQPIRIMAGPNGSIQGPCEAKWGYTTLCVADWDGDGKLDLVVNSIWGIVVWFRNVGTREVPRFEREQLVEVAWPAEPPKPAWTWWKPTPKMLATQWRTTPVVIDWNHDERPDLVMLDHEGFLSLFTRDGSALKPGERVFSSALVSNYNNRHTPLNAIEGDLRLNGEPAGKSGRRTLCITDWDGDGKLDVIVDSLNANWLKNMGTQFRDQGPVDTRRLAGHSTCPTTVGWTRDGVRDLIVGAEDGKLYRMSNPNHR